MKIVLINNMAGRDKIHGNKHYPCIFEDHPEDKGRCIATFDTLTEALEYIIWKGFEIVFTDFK